MSLGDERIPARTVLWAAGVAASPLAQTLGVPLDRAGRVLVAPDLTVPGHAEVFVIGDLAALEQDGKLVPGVAPGGDQEGRHAARNIRRHAARASRAGRSATSTRAASPPSAAAPPSGTSSGKLRLSGFLAWLAWLFIHIFFLIGFRNRVAGDASTGPTRT